MSSLTIHNTRAHASLACDNKTNTVATCHWSQLCCHEGRCEQQEESHSDTGSALLKS